MHTLAWWPTVAVLLMATISDLRSRKIPNWLVLPFMLTGLGAAIYQHGWAGATHSLCGLALAAVMCGVPAYLGALGMGDVKLCAAIGAWIGPTQLVTALIFTGLAGGLIAIGWGLWKGFLSETFQNSRSLLAHFGRNGIEPHPQLVLSNPTARTIPYAPAIFIGTLLSFFAGSI
jgi:prepilin peptidase CpaA